MDCSTNTTKSDKEKNCLLRRILYHSYLNNNSLTFNEFTTDLSISLVVKEEKDILSIVYNYTLLS